MMHAETSGRAESIILILDFAESSECQNILKRLRSAGFQMQRLDEQLAATVLILELYNRRRPVRAVEWVVSSVIPPWVRPSITRGPFQIANGPWKLTEAFALCVTLMADSISASSNMVDIYTNAARAWHGAAERQAGGAIGYAEALHVVHEWLALRLAD